MISPEYARSLESSLLCSQKCMLAQEMLTYSTFQIRHAAGINHYSSQQHALIEFAANTATVAIPGVLGFISSSFLTDGKKENYLSNRAIATCI